MIAHLVGSVYENVTFQDAFNAPFSQTVDMSNFGTDRILVVRTSEGRFYNLGNPYFDNFNWSMHFDYEELLPPPPPARDENLGIDADVSQMGRFSFRRVSAFF